jgi:hypothetical protein
VEAKQNIYIMTKIKIGADELIYWLRKNEKAVGVQNDGFGGLQQKFINLFERLGVSKIEDHYPSYYANTSNFGQMNLPKTSAQYEIATSKLGELYDALNQW